MFNLRIYLSSALILIADCPWPKQEAERTMPETIAQKFSRQHKY